MEGPGSLRSTDAPQRGAGAYRVPGVIATAPASETPRRSSGGNDRNDALHWLRGCSSCGGQRDGARHWPLGRGAGLF